MPTRQRAETRAPSDRMIDLHEGGARVGYASESLRNMMFKPNPPPYFKVRGRWRAWLSDLDAWAEAQGMQLLDLPDDQAS